VPFQARTNSNRRSKIVKVRFMSDTLQLVVTSGECSGELKGPAH